MNYLYIFIGGGLGSVARYGISRFSQGAFSQLNFPIGTFLANVLACVILALLVLITDGKYTDNVWLKPLMIIGFCGGFSTFSTFSNETVTLIEDGHFLWAIANVLLSVVVGVGLIFMIKSTQS